MWIIATRWNCRMSSISTTQVSPVFIFSLPRAGSTLLQRMLAADPRIDTASEPWILLPFFYTTRSEGIFTEYYQRSASRALDDFCGRLPNGRADLQEAIKLGAEYLYNLACQKEALYFVDKTPRYHLIVEDIISTFGDEAKYIFLWRNPISVMHSMLTTWTNNRWELYRYRVDLYKGMSNLTTSFERHSSTSIQVRYEDLVQSPTSVIANIMGYLDLPFESSVFENWESVRLSGRMGDPTGTVQYKNVSNEPVNKWTSQPLNSVRRTYYRNYLHWLGADRLALMGYSLGQLLDELDAVPATSSGVIRDRIWSLFGRLHPIIEPTIAKTKMRSARQSQRMYPHG